ncbi:hypothetical protein IJ162_01255 [Candidatus Saccharibacteria bacterium]|nr:hypothetical protein [Candidatus Saccharibacteria bacterium]
MKASYKEAGKTRKWLFSVLATIILVFSFVTPSFVTTQGSVYADSSIDEVDESVKTDKDDDDVTCMNSGAGKSLGWILCPVLDLLTNTAEKTYNSIIKPSMNIESDLFDQSKAGAGTHSAWSVFQGIANVAFVILFMVVIVSQVTGIGINNYGIKKILPKLIVVAILVNISWYICVIATDVSNIIGNSIQELFEHLPTTADGEAASITLATVSGGERAINIAAKGTLNSVAILGAVAGIGAIIINPAILLSLLISALGVVISVFTLFVLLSARQALVVVLTVISPVAIVCFMLPNTKKIFDRWLKISEGMLLVYPICGLLVGGGDYVSKLLLTLANQGGFFIVLTAMIVGIVPIFFIPTVLKKSFAAAGDIGAKISGYGQRIRGGAQGAARNSSLNRNAQQRGLERRNRIMAGVDKNGNIKDGKFANSRLNRFLRGGDRNVAMARQAYLKDVESKNRVEDMMSTGFESAVSNVQDKASALRTADYESLLNNGKATLENGTVIVVNDANSVGQYHAQALKRFAGAKNDAERAEAMAQIKAAQNILSKTDKGRTQVQANLQNSLAAGETGALTAAASHLMGAYADKYKAVNRGAESLIRELSTTNFDADPSAVSTMQAKLSNGNYSFAGHDKYTAESLVNADEAAIENFAQAIDNINSGLPAPASFDTTAQDNIRATAYEALQKQKAGTLNIKPEVKAKLERMVAGYTPKETPNSRAQLISHGAFEDSAGNVIHLREMDNGKFLDDSGAEVDITHYKRH